LRNYSTYGPALKTVDGIEVLPFTTFAELLSGGGLTLA
jgi:hypothetical protein